MKLIPIRSANSNFKDYCIRVFSYVNPGSTFLSISNYRNNFDEHSDFSVCFNANYINAVRRSLNIVSEFDPYNISVNNISTASLEAAKAKIINSFILTLGVDNPYYTCKGVYEQIIGANNKPIPGIKLHTEQDVVHINALKIKKTIIKQGSYPEYNSAPETIARKYIMRYTPLANWVQFKLEKDKFDRLTVQRMQIEGN